jgi:hypothetical protein
MVIDYGKICNFFHVFVARCGPASPQSLPLHERWGKAIISHSVVGNILPRRARFPIQGGENNIAYQLVDRKYSISGRITVG